MQICISEQITFWWKVIWCGLYTDNRAHDCLKYFINIFLDPLSFIMLNTMLFHYYNLICFISNYIVLINYARRNDFLDSRFNVLVMFNFSFIYLLILYWDWYCYLWETDISQESFVYERFLCYTLFFQKKSSNAYM